MVRTQKHRTEVPQETYVVTQDRHGPQLWVRASPAIHLLPYLVIFIPQLFSSPYLILLFTNYVIRQHFPSNNVISVNFGFHQDCSSKCNCCLELKQRHKNWILQMRVLANTSRQHLDLMPIQGVLLESKGIKRKTLHWLDP